MNRKAFLAILTISIWAALSTQSQGQTTSAGVSPNPKPTPPTQISSNKRTYVKRTSGVTIAVDEKNVENPVVVKRTDQIKAEPEGEAKSLSAERNANDLEREKEDAAKANAERIAAGLALLELEKQKAADEALKTAREAFDKKEADLKKKADEERLMQAAEIERIKAENEAAKKKAADNAEAEKKRVADELAAAQMKAENEAAARVIALRNEQLAKMQAEAAAKQRIEAEKAAAAQLEAARIEKAKLRTSLIDQIVAKLKVVDGAAAQRLVPDTAASADDIEKALKASIAANPKLTKRLDFCTPEFEGAPFNLEMSADATFGTLLQELRNSFGINFLPDAEVLDLPIRVNVDNEPWNRVLRSQLNFLDLEARCEGVNTISILKRVKLQTLQENQRKTAPLRTEFIKLRFLRPQVGGQSNLAGKSTGTSSVESLEQTIQKILVSNGDSRGSIGRIPGRAEFFITATEQQLEQIKAVIAKADRPTYRVDVFGLVYTVNENKLRDVGSQLSIVLNGEAGARVGGISTLPTRQSGSSTGGGGTGSTTGSVINGLPPGFTQPSGSLQAGSANTILGARVKVGIAEFAYQLSLLEQLGVARRVEKPFVSAKDGTTGTFENGTQIPVIVQALNNFGSAGGQIDFINAGTTLSATPQVIEDETGKPELVNLTLRLESNTPDLSITTAGNVPSVNSRRIQNEITIAPNQAFIFGGSNDLIDTKNESKTPGLGSIPVVGNLFKRKTKQQTDNKLYFAVWVQISLDDGTSPVETNNLDTNFAVPPPMSQPLTLPMKKSN